MARKATGTVVERKRDRGRVYGLRFRAYGQRHYVTLPDGTSREEAEKQLRHTLADVERGVWKPVEPEPEVELRQEPEFHEFASRWLEAQRPGLGERTVEYYTWALSNHLLPFFQRHQLKQISVEEVDRYRTTKVRQRELSNNSINKTLTVLGQVLEAGVEYGHMEKNPARGRKRRCRSNKPRRASMSAVQVAALLDAAGSHRALIATAIMAGGLRVSEVTGLRRRDLNLPAGTLAVAASKTEAGVRVVDLDPWLRDELAAYVAGADLGPDDFLFPSRGGRRRERNATRAKILYPAIDRANAFLEDKGLPTISEDVTFHSLRRTYASLAAEANVDPAWTAAQIGHEDATFTLRVYTDVHQRMESPASKLGALVRSAADWAPLGTSADSEDSEASTNASQESEKAPH
jgi:integrase